MRKGLTTIKNHQVRQVIGIFAPFSLLLRLLESAGRARRRGGGAAGAGLHDFGEGVELRVRMGIHTGEPVVTAEGYVGQDVHLGCRVRSSTRGMSILPIGLLRKRGTWSSAHSRPSRRWKVNGDRAACSRPARRRCADGKSRRRRRAVVRVRRVAGGRPVGLPSTRPALLVVKRRRPMTRAFTHRGLTDERG